LEDASSGKRLTLIFITEHEFVHRLYLLQHLRLSATIEHDQATEIRRKCSTDERDAE
jgi:hypothetical protein